MNIGFVGLGVMGFPMAGHLARAGHTVTVYNRTSSKALEWTRVYGGEVAATPCEAAQRAQLVFLCVGNDEDVRAVCSANDGVLAGMVAGGVIVDHTTASANLAREMADRAGERDLHFIDAPVSGGQAGAENGVLTVMAGGNEDAFARVAPVLCAYSRCARLLGPSGAGQLAKMVNQVCIAGVVQGLSEGLLFADRAGLDSAAVIEVISQGAAQSWQMENRYETMLAGQYEHGFAVDWMRKDLGMVLEEARRLGIELPVTELVDGFYAQVQAMGGGRWDTSSLFARMQKES